MDLSINHQPFTIAKPQQTDKTQDMSLTKHR